MARINLFLFGLIAALSLIFVRSSANADEQMASGMGRAFGANEIIGAHVKNPQGDMLGRISDLVVDSEGRVALVVLSNGGFLGIHEKEAAVPFGSLSFDRTDKSLILNISKEELASAPTFRMSDFSDQKRVESVYRYFGQQPYWSEGGEPFTGLNDPLEKMPAARQPYLYPYE